MACGSAGGLAGDEGTVVVMFEAIGDDSAQLAAPAEEPVALDAGEVMLF